MKIKLEIDGIEYECKEVGKEIEKAPVITLYEKAVRLLGMNEVDYRFKDLMKWMYGDTANRAWCATFVCKLAYELGLQEQTGKFDSVDAIKTYMNKRGMLDCTKNYGGGQYKAKHGDLCFFSSKNIYDDCTHIAIVDKIKDNKLYYIGGNQNDMVTIKEINLDSKYLVAYGSIIY